MWAVGPAGARRRDAAQQATKSRQQETRAVPLRYKTRPAGPFSPHVRYKTRPARPKRPILAHFAHAWRTFYRMRGRDGASHHSTPGLTGVEGAGGTGGPGCCARGWWAVGGGRWRGLATHRRPDRLEAAARPAGPGRASSRRAERSSRRGRRAGGQAARRPEICRGNKQQARIQKRPPGTGWAYLSRLWESNPRPIHYE